MAANPYPNLGWNPVPGIPAEVAALQQKVKAAASALDNSHRQIEKLLGESAHWEGDAADAFRDALDGELPKYMGNAARSLEKAAAWLDIWNGDLSSHRDLAKKYDEEAGEKKAAAEKAKRHHDDAAGHPDLQLAGRQFPSQQEADAATARLRAAERSLNAATTQVDNANQAYQDVLTKARRLENENRGKAVTVAQKLDEADDKLAPKEPGWLSRSLEAIGEALKGAGQFLLDHAGTIGAIAGLLALFPTPLAPAFAAIAIVASAAALGKNLSSGDFRDSLMGEHGWKAGLTAWGSVVGDTLGVVPGVGMLARAGSEVGLAAAVARESGEAMSLGSKVTSFAGEVKAVNWNRAVDTATSPSMVRDWALNGLNATANTVSSVETAGLLPDDGIGHDSTEATKAGVALSGAAGTLGTFGTDLVELAGSIRL
ncbi:putative T7SS-secreted protein [Streptomyces ziwulingensis]|uniref:Putative T7SS secretion signal domain-containing protein n=1 Tax=Streptomyces ziwulingensis TaxID=1045501 RepID=A0ABP9B0T0_9ACTN